MKHHLGPSVSRVQHPGRRNEETAWPLRYSRYKNNNHHRRLGDRNNEEEHPVAIAEASLVVADT